MYTSVSEDKYVYEYMHNYLHVYKNVTVTLYKPSMGHVMKYRIFPSRFCVIVSLFLTQNSPWEGGGVVLGSTPHPINIHINFQSVSSLASNHKFGFVIKLQ